MNYLSNVQAADQVVQGIRAAGGQAIALQGDVRNADDVDRVVQNVHEIYGRVDGLVGNASMRFVRKPVLEISWDELAQKLNDEIKAAFELTRSVGPIMVAQGSGRIVYVRWSSSNRTSSLSKPVSVG